MAHQICPVSVCTMLLHRPDFCITDREVSILISSKILGPYYWHLNSVIQKDEYWKKVARHFGQRPLIARESQYFLKEQHSVATSRKGPYMNVKYDMLCVLYARHNDFQVSVSWELQVTDKLQKNDEATVGDTGKHQASSEWTSPDFMTAVRGKSVSILGSAVANMCTAGTNDDHKEILDPKLKNQRQSENKKNRLKY